MSTRPAEKLSPWQRWTKGTVSGLQTAQLCLAVLPALAVPVWQLYLRVEKLEWEHQQVVNRRAEDLEWRRQTEGDLKAVGNSVARQTATLEAVMALMRKGS